MQKSDTKDPMHIRSWEQSDQ